MLFDIVFVFNLNISFTLPQKSVDYTPVQGSCKSTFTIEKK